MLLIPENSLCEAFQKILVSRDIRTQRKHCAHNSQQKYRVRHYKLDGDIVSQQKCCDFLLTNDTLRRAYFIELKGGNIDDAIPQLEGGVRLTQPELDGYDLYFRIVPSKVHTHDVQKNSFRKFKDKWGSHLQYRSDFFEESL